jgi:hypothetical protein
MRYVISRKPDTRIDYFYMDLNSTAYLKVRRARYGQVAVPVACIESHKTRGSSGIQRVIQYLSI